MKKLFYAFLAMNILLSSCTEEEDTQPKVELISVGSAVENDLKIELQAEEALFVGYNVITAKVTDASGAKVSGSVEIQPIMDMMTMSHSCPLQYISGQTLTNGELEFAAVFVMPSGDMGTWSIMFTVGEQTVEVPVEIVQPTLSKLISFTSSADETKKYFVALIEPQAPEVGANEMVIGIYQKESMMSWPAVDGLKLELTPWMTSMDHGSPNNVAPLSAGNGLYNGTVNFTMTGDWQLRLTVMDGETVIGAPYFDILFQ